MHPRKFDISTEANPEIPYNSNAFQQSVQTALLLALLEKGLLTHSQFDRCLSEIQKPVRTIKNQ